MPGGTMTDSISHAQMLSTMRKQRFQDFMFHKVTMLFALSVLIVLVGIIISLIMESIPAFKTFGLHFIVSAEWDPVNDQYGALIPIIGTLVTSVIALLIAFPVSFGIALFLTEICPAWLRRPLGTAVELLAGVPSIIYGIWGLFVFAPLFADHVQPILKATLGNVPVIGQLFSGPMMGIGLLTAGLVLAIMIIPFIASVMRDVFEIVPAVLKESAYGLGCTRWEVVRKIVLPYTKTGVVGGVMLGLGRALGETMAVTFVIGNANKLSWSLFAAGNSITSLLANEFGEAQSELHVASLFSLALILFVITFIVLSAAKLMLAGMSRKEGTK
ncbi:phosphate ABC transporter permease subunit PstC [Janthinobacterium lividum]|jgi:phosphate transport system permease protein|nr:phosphate ABC transporter permease subunit PstC [Janthinobacterium sp. AD80]MBR7632160.1 phosphate ABC transporter permease subunit PstC [Janthinobacterium lividum]MCC7699390.1 phosphate ABC transporter permease subunit PstC [Janthinobacterium sp. EB271-G4-7A]MCC7716597.1 phosphate ABC transporter permease subunit PstC [Janthinobacterium lividum]QSX99152.1 phosphate ABC transporter permease subunit PstC [Janthinobacterium lividum]